MRDRITAAKLEVMLALYCAERGIECDHPEDGGWKHPEDRRVGGLSINHTQVNGGSVVVVRTPGGGEGEHRIFGSMRRPRRELFGLIRVAWLLLCEQRDERRGVIGDAVSMIDAWHGAPTPHERRVLRDLLTGD